MDIVVTGRKIEVGESLQAHIREKLQAIADKYFSRAVNASVTLSKNGYSFGADCHLHAPNNVVLQSHGEASEPYVAFDDAAEKMEKQLRRYKRKIKNHHVSGGKNVEPPEESDGATA